MIPGLEGRFRLGRTETVRDGSDILIFTLGSISAEVCKAAQELANEGIEATVSVVSSLRPAPVQDILDLLPRFSVALTVEEHYVDGRFRVSRIRDRG